MISRYNGNKLVQNFVACIDDMLVAWKSRVSSGIQLRPNKSICMGSLLYADNIVLIQGNEDSKIVLTDNFSEKTKTMAFKGKYLVKTKVVTNNNTF